MGRIQKTAVVFVHGLMTEKNKSILQDLEHFFPKTEFNCFYFNYGFLFILGAIRDNQKIANKLSEQVNSLYQEYERVVLVGHSNGCALINIASRDFHWVDLAVFLHGASPRETFPKNVKTLHVYYSPKDWIIRIIHRNVLYPFKWLRKKTGWGDIGLKGYKGILRESAENFKVDTSGLTGFQSHYAVFRKLNVYGPLIVSKINEQIGRVLK